MLRGDKFVWIPAIVSRMTRRARRLLAAGKSWSVGADTILMFVLLCTVSGAFVFIARGQARMVEELSFHWGGSVAAPLSEPHVVVIMQPTDCVENRALLERMSVVLSRGGLPVHGLLSVSRGERTVVRSLIEGSTLPFPLVEATAGHVAVGLQAIGIRSTPVVVLVDGEGRVRYLTPLAAATLREDVELLLDLSKRL